MKTIYANQNTVEDDMKTKQIAPSFFGEFGDSITFSTSVECRPDAAQIAWRPSNNEFRRKRLPDGTKYEEERFFLNLYLHHLFSAKRRLKCPVTYRRAGRNNEPDFEVIDGEGASGLEISRATTERSEILTAKLFKADAGYSIFPNSELYHDGSAFNPKLFIHPDDESPSNDALLGLEQEFEWARQVVNRIKIKQEILNNLYSKSFSECELVLYSSGHVLTGDLHEGTSLIKNLYASLPSPLISFTTVTVVQDNWAVFDVLGKAQVFDKRSWSRCKSELPLSIVNMHSEILPR